MASSVKKSTGYIYGTSGTITLPSVEATDGILVFLGYDNNGTISYTIDTSGYTKVTTQNTANRSIASFYKANAAGTEAAISLSGMNGTYPHPWIAFVIPGAHTTSMISTTVTGNGAASNQPSGTTYTTGHADVVNFLALNIDGQRWSNFDQNAQFLAEVEGFTTSASPANRMQAAYQVYPSTGTTSAPRAYIDGSTNHGILQVPVRMATNNLLPGPILGSQPIDIITPLMEGSGSFGGAYGGSHDTGIAADFTDIDGYSTIHDETTFSFSTGRSPRGYNWATQVRVNGGSEELGVVGINVTETDYSGKRLIFNMNLLTYAAFASYAAGSAYFGIRTDKSGTLGWRVWRLPSATATPDPNKWITLVLDVDNTDYVTEVGTYDSTKVDGFLLGVRRETQDTQLYFHMIAIMNTMEMGHGSSGNALTFDDFVQYSETHEIKTFRKLAAGQYEHSHDWMAGDGSTRIYLEQDGFSLLSEQENDEAAFVVGYRSDTLPLGGWNTTANCVLKLTNGTIGGASVAPFTIDTDAGTDTDLTGLVIDNKELTWTSSGAANLLDGLELRRCNAITLDYAQVITVNNTRATTGGAVITGATQAALQTALDMWASCNLNNCTAGAGLYISFTGTGDVSLNSPANLTWSGNTTDVHYNSTNSSALTVVMGTNGNADQAKVATSGNATGVTISNDKTFSRSFVDESGTSITGVNAGLIKVSDSSTVDHDSAVSGGTYSYVHGGTTLACRFRAFKPGFRQYTEDPTLGNSDDTSTVTLFAAPASQN